MKGAEHRDIIVLCGHTPKTVWCEGLESNHPNAEAQRNRITACGSTGLTHMFLCADIPSFFVKSQRHEASDDPHQSSLDTKPRWKGGSVPQSHDVTAHSAIHCYIAKVGGRCGGRGASIAWPSSPVPRPPTFAVTFAACTVTGWLPADPPPPNAAWSPAGAVPGHPS